MINARISNTYLGLTTEGGYAIQLQFEVKDKQYVVGPIYLADFTPIAALIKTTEVSCWEQLIGQVVQIEIEDEKVVKMANVLNDELYLNFTEAPKEEDTLNQEVEE